MARPIILRCSSPMLPLVAALDRACFPEPIPGDDLIAYLKLPAAGLEDGLFSLVDSGPIEVPLSVMLVLPAGDDGGHLPAAYMLLVARESYCLIDRIGVHPDHRGKHYAAALLAAAALSGGPIGIRTWGVELRESDLASQQFFQHMGFLALPASERSRGWFGQDDAVVMTRTI